MRTIAAACIAFASSLPSEAAQLFAADQYPEIAETIITLRYANQRCPEFGLHLSYEGNMFNELVKQAQARDRELMKTIYAVGERELPSLNAAGYPLYCMAAEEKYPGMFKRTKSTPVGRQ